MSGRTAWVTGGASGIGAEIVATLLRQRTRVGVLDVKPIAGEDAAYVQCDVADPDLVRGAAAKLKAETGSPDILVNNAGTSVNEPVDTLTDQDWARVLAVNLSGPFYLSREVLPAMRAKGWGRIVSIASSAAVRVAKGTSAYSASKAGLIALTKTIAIEGAAYGITANTIAPGITDTPMSRASLGDLEAAVREGPFANPMAEVLQPADMAEGVAFLVSDAARRITGQVLYINAGALMP